MSEDGTTEPTLDEATETDAPASIDDEWADEYPEDAQLFCAKFDAEDFDDFYGRPHPNGETIAVRFAKPPTSGFFARNRDRTPVQLGFDVIQQHMCERAWNIFCDLNDDAQNEFVEKWSGDTFNQESAGKATGSNRSSRRAENKKRR